MKKNMTAARTIACLILSVFFFSSCMKDSCRHHYSIVTPVYEQLSTLRNAVQRKVAQPIVHTGKLYIKDNWIFLNEQNRGIHVIDNSNPVHPVKTAFINIPGNIDMSVKGDILYADLYCDVAAIRISDPSHITVAKYLTRIFPEKAAFTNSTNPDSIYVITGWSSRDTMVSCDVEKNISSPVFYAAAASQSSSASGVQGQAGSMARFAAVNDYLYAISTSSLHVICIQEAANPVLVKSKVVGGNMETLFPYDNKLYIGAGSSMSVYDLQDPADPRQLSWSGHWCSRDPVVADNNYAYVTLHEANVCNDKVNQLEIYNLATPNAPGLAATYPLTSPQGLSKQGNLLFICDGKAGLKIFDASDITAIKLLKQFTGTEPYDVIASGGIAYVVAKDGLYQYDYSNLQNIRLLSKLAQ